MEIEKLEQEIIEILRKDPQQVGQVLRTWLAEPTFKEHVQETLAKKKRQGKRK